MALDFYVGSLTRYFSGDWEAAEDNDEDDDDEDDEPIDPDDALEDVREWQRSLNDALGEHLRAPLDWNEAADSPYFTETLSREFFGSLMLWAAYAERGNGASPPEKAVKKWTHDPVFKRCVSPDSKTLYPNLLYGCEQWLPCELPGVMEVGFTPEEPFHLGSTLALRRELAALNEATWKATPGELEVLRSEQRRSHRSVEQSARLALALLVDLVEKSVRHRLPMLLDS